MPLGLGISCKVCLLFFISLVVTYFRSESCRRYNLKGLRWCVDRDVQSWFGLGPVNSPAKRFSWGLRFGGNYVWCLVIVVIFMGLREAKWSGEGGVLKSSYVGRKPQRRDNTFYGRELTPLGTMYLSIFLLVYEISNKEIKTLLFASSFMMRLAIQINKHSGNLL